MKWNQRSHINQTVRLETAGGRTHQVVPLYVQRTVSWGGVIKRLIKQWTTQPGGKSRVKDRAESFLLHVYSSHFPLLHTPTATTMQTYWPGQILQHVHEHNYSLIKCTNSASHADLWAGTWQGRHDWYKWVKQTAVTEQSIPLTELPALRACRLSFDKENSCSSLTS